jgi:hypothetical protein
MCGITLTEVERLGATMVESPICDKCFYIKSTKLKEMDRIKNAWAVIPAMYKSMLNSKEQYEGIVGKSTLIPVDERDGDSTHLMYDILQVYFSVGIYAKMINAIEFNNEMKGIMDEKKTDKLDRVKDYKYPLLIDEYAPDKVNNEMFRSILVNRAEKNLVTVLSIFKRTLVQPVDGNSAGFMPTKAMIEDIFGYKFANICWKSWAMPRHGEGSDG